MNNYCNAPASIRPTVTIVNTNAIIIEKIKSIIFPSNHHQNTIQRITIILLKCRLLGNVIFYKKNLE
jgi:hypothetical protein